MERGEKARWNQKYREGSRASLEPDAFLVSAYAEFVGAGEVGSALDVAGGAGRHAIWLAERGWTVKLVDVSEAAVELARKNARDRGLVIETEIADLNLVQDLGRGKYDLVLVFFFLQRQLFSALVSALKPGGHLLYKTYTIKQTRLGGGPSHPEYWLKPGELLHSFASLRVLHYSETVQDRGVAELAGRNVVASDGSSVAPKAFL
jgi:tellurite methyltransferase